MALRKLSGTSGFNYGTDGILRLSNGNFLYVDIEGLKYYVYTDISESTCDLFIECPHLNNDFYHKIVTDGDDQKDVIFAKRYYILKNSSQEAIVDTIYETSTDDDGSVDFTTTSAITYAEYSGYYVGLKPIDPAFNDLQYTCYAFNKYESQDIDNYSDLLSTFTDINDGFTMNNPAAYDQDFSFSIYYHEADSNIDDDTSRYICEFDGDLPSTSLDNTIADIRLTHSSNDSSLTYESVSDDSLSNIVNSRTYQTYQELYDFVNGIEVSFNRISSKLLFIDPQIYVVTNIPKEVRVTLTGIPSGESVSFDSLSVTSSDNIQVDKIGVPSISNDKAVFLLHVTAEEDIGISGCQLDVSYSFSTEEGIRQCSATLFTSHTQKYVLEKDGSGLNSVSYYKTVLTEEDGESEESEETPTFINYTFNDASEDNQVLELTNTDIVTLKIEGYAELIGAITLVGSPIYDDTDYTTTISFKCNNVSDNITLNKITVKEKPFNVCVEYYMGSTLYKREVLTITNDQEGLDSVIGNIPNATSQVVYGTSGQTFTKLPFAWASASDEAHTIKVIYTKQPIIVRYNNTPVGSAHIEDLDAIRDTGHIFCNTEDINLGDYIVISSTGKIRFSNSDVVEETDESTGNTTLYIDLVNANSYFFRIRKEYKDFIIPRANDITIDVTYLYRIYYDKINLVTHTLEETYQQDSGRLFEFDSNSFSCTKKCCIKDSYASALNFAPAGSTISNGDDINGKDIIVEDGNYYLVGKCYSYQHSIIDEQNERRDYLIEKKYKTKKSINIIMKSHVPTTNNTLVTFNINPGVDGLVVNLSPLNGHTYDKYFTLTGKSVKPITGIKECTLTDYSLDCKFAEGQRITNIETLLVPLLNK